MKKTGGQLIVEALEVNGVDRIFSVPGESYLAVLDALHDSKIRNFVCRQEGGAAMMADCHARLTGQPGICFVTRGPGATNASAGIHISAQDSIPTILFIGQVARGNRHREAFQEIDYRAFYGSIAKWVVEIDDAARIPELVTRAFAVATSGRPGPVVIALPEDMLTDEVEAPLLLPYTPVEMSPGPNEMERLEELLKGAERPFVVLGGTRWTAEAVKRMCAGLERWKLPVGCSFRRQSLCDQLHPSYAGDVGIGINPKLADYIKNADVLLLVGCRMGEMPSADYTLTKSPYPDQKLVHVYPDPHELGRVYRPELAIAATVNGFSAAFAKLQPEGNAGLGEPHGGAAPGLSRMVDAAEEGRRRRPYGRGHDLAGGDAARGRHHHQWRRQFRQLGAPLPPLSPPRHAGGTHLGLDGLRRAGGRGGQGAASGPRGDHLRGRRRLHDARPGIRHRGAVRPALHRHHPEQRHLRHDPHAPGAGLSRPRFGHRPEEPRFRRLCPRLRRAMARRWKTEEFAPAFERARASGKPAIIEVKMSPEAITPTKTLSEIREGR
jgi:acetolactate synthase I/II/III large subunit